MADRRTLRLAATLVLTGFVLAVVAQYVHTTIDSSISSVNNNPAEFIVISASDNWTAVALAQFAATALIVAGLLVVSYTLDLTAGIPAAVNRLGAVAAVVCLALDGVVYAVAGVGLKQAADSWVRSPVAQQGASFAGAETIRWLQWGATSYQIYMFALALVLVATAIVWTGRITRPLGVIMGLQGIAYLVVGWQVGIEGLAFTGIQGVAYYLGSALLFIWMVWLLIVAWRMKKPVPAANN